MGVLGKIRRSLKRRLLDTRDVIHVARMRRGEINKFRDPRRVAIFSKVNLSREQQ